MRSLQYWILFFGSSMVSILLIRQIVLSREINQEQRVLVDSREMISLGSGFETLWQQLAIRIYQASRQAMVAALSQLNPLPDYLLLDAIEIDLPIEQKALIHGDARSISIAAASILAKVERDRRMEEFDQIYPQYGLAQHKGYGTPEHLEALRMHGPTPLHRFSYAPVRESRCWAAGAVQNPLPLEACEVTTIAIAPMA